MEIWKTDQNALATVAVSLYTYILKTHLSGSNNLWVQERRNEFYKWTANGLENQTEDKCIKTCA